MKRYTEKSKVRQIKVVRSKSSESFFAEIIKDPAVNIPKIKQKEASTEISRLVEKSWGKFPRDYLNSSILHSQRLLLLRNNKKQLIGVAPIKKVQIDGHYVYSFGLTAVDPDYQGLGFMKQMHNILGKGVFIENFLHGKLKVEFVFITPNIRTIGALAKVADYIYPNPYAIDEKTGMIDYADDKTWETIKLYLKATGEKVRKLDRRGNVLVGFYDDKPNLIVLENENIPDKMLRIFAKHYLKPGNEVVVRAIISLGGIFRNGI
jgi:RimJ/RimL family protein N-acetyltransferase